MQGTTSILPQNTREVTVKASPVSGNTAREVHEDSAGNIAMATAADGANDTITVHKSDARWMKACGLINSVPTVANPIANQAGTAAVPWSFQFDADVFDDGDAGASLTYTATLANDSPLPGWLTFTPATRTFSGTPPAAATHSIKVTASDGLDSVSDTFDLVVAGA